MNECWVPGGLVWSDSSPWGERWRIMLMWDRDSDRWDPSVWFSLEAVS